MKLKTCYTTKVHYEIEAEEIINHEICYCGEDDSLSEAGIFRKDSNGYYIEWVDGTENTRIKTGDEKLLKNLIFFGEILNEEE